MTWQDACIAFMLITGKKPFNTMESILTNEYTLPKLHAKYGYEMIGQYPSTFEVTFEFNLD